MKYVIAIVACAAEISAYAFIGVLLGWKNGGGIIPMLILMAVCGATWTAITRRGIQPEESKGDEGAQSENPND